MKTASMRSKVVASLAEALEGIRDGATVMVGGFGRIGEPVALLEQLLAHGARELTVVNNNAGNGTTGLAALLAAGRVRKVVCTYPRQADSHVFDGLYRAGRVELELVPQGTLAERIRAGGAGVPAFYTATGFGTELAKGKETREFDGRGCVLERALRADVALIAGYVGDRAGNVVYRKTARNYGPLMAAAADLTVAQVDRVVEPGQLDPERVVTPGIYIDRLVVVGDRAWGHRGA